MARHDINTLLNANHAEFFRCTDREVLFYGGAGAGKSFSVADKLLLQPFFQNRPLRILVIRKTLKSLKRTCIPILENRAEVLKIPFQLNKTDFVAKYAGNSEFIFHGMDNPNAYEALKSITDIDIIWMEEVNEVQEAAYDAALLRLRGGRGRFHQIISTVNPVSTKLWLYDRWFIRNVGGITKFHTTVADNPYIDKDYIDALDALKFSNENLYKVYRLGEWGQLQGVVYDHYKIIDRLPEKFDEKIYGLDFGFNNPTALVEVRTLDNEDYIAERIYESGLTNSDIVMRLKELGVGGGDIIYCDAAEPARIEEICRAGFNAKAARKDVRPGIDFCKSRTMYYTADSENLLKEAQTYCWKLGPDGKPLDEPVKFADHLMDAKRYAIFTHNFDRKDVRARFI